MKPATLIAMAASTLMLAAEAAFSQSFLEQLEQRLQGAIPRPAPAPAAAPSDPNAGYLGLYADETDATRDGVRINELVVGGPANKAGLRPGDTITAIDGKPISRLAEMVDALTGKAPGTRVRFQVLRAGERRDYIVELGTKSNAAAAPGVPEALPVPNAPQAAPQRASLGVTVTDVTDADIIRYGLRSRRGAIVRSVREGAPAKRFGVTVGSLIVAANGRNVGSPDDLVTIISGLTADDSVELSYYIGKQLFTKDIPLGDAATVDAPPAITADAPLRIVPPGEDRPLLRGLEKALNGIVGPQVDAAAVADENAALREQVDSMREELRQLRARMAELEKRLGEQAANAPQVPEPVPPAGDE